MNTQNKTLSLIFNSLFESTIVAGLVISAFFAGIVVGYIALAMEPL